MNDKQLDNIKHEQAQEYVTPTIETFTPENLLTSLGPAQGYGGGRRKGPGKLEPQRLFY